jgi:hypothetical protein
MLLPSNLRQLPAVVFNPALVVFPALFFSTAVLFSSCRKYPLGAPPMEWTTPQHEEIDLNCEVSSYANAEL